MGEQQPVSRVAIFCEHTQLTSRPERTHLGTFVKLKPGITVEQFDSWQFQGTYSNKKHPIPDPPAIGGPPPRTNKQGHKALGGSLLGRHCRLRSTFQAEQNQHLPALVREALTAIGPFVPDRRHYVPALRFDAAGTPYRLERDLYTWELYNEQDPNRQYRSVAVKDSYLLKCPRCPNQQIRPVDHSALVDICERWTAAGQDAMTVQQLIRLAR